MTDLKLQDFLKAGLTKDPVFEANDTCAAVWPWPALPEKVWKAGRTKDYSQRGILYVLILFWGLTEFKTVEAARLPRVLQVTQFTAQ